MDMSKTWSFFHGACQNNKVGLRFSLYIRKNLVFYIKAHLGDGINNKGELLACFYLLKLASQQGTLALQVFGDSSLVINHIHGTIMITSISLQSLAQQH